MMIDWMRHWDTFPQNYDDSSFFEQVGKTVNGIPISQELFQLIVTSVVENLRIDMNDDILDLCCGNGIITREISYKCKSITGVDYSKKLIEVAKKHNLNDNTCYFRENGIKHVLECNDIYDKVFMYEALQHFNSEDLRLIISNIARLFKGDVQLLICSVPDKAKIWNYYNTLQRKVSYYWRTLRGREAIGTWWDKCEIDTLCKRAGFKVKFIEQNPRLHTSHYRFDFLVTR